MVAPLLLVVCLAAGPDGVRFQDDFTTDTRKEYTTEGDVSWQQGRLSLGPAAQLTRKLPLGPTADVRATVRVPPEVAEITVRLQGEAGTAAVALRGQKGRIVLVNQANPPEEITLPPGDASGIWVLRCELRYGLLRARAWPQGSPEPNAWQTTRYYGSTALQPQTVTVAAGREAGGVLTALSVAGPLPSQPSAEGQRKSAQLGDLNRRMNALHREGRTAEAVPLVREALALAEEVFGPEHPTTVTWRNGLAALQTELGEFAAARAQLDQAMAACGKLLGPEHPETVATLRHLGTLCRAQGDYAAGRAYFEQALAAGDKVLGRRHLSRAEVLHQLAYLLVFTGDFVAGRKYAQESVDLFRELRGPRSLEVAAALTILGGLVQEIGDYEAARQHYQEAADLVEAALGPRHPQTIHVRCLVGEALLMQGDAARARPLIEPAYELVARQPNPRPPDLTYKLDVMAQLYEALGEPARARTYLEKGIALARKAHGPNNPLTARMLGDLGDVLLAQGDRAAARAALEEALAINRKGLDPEHPEIARNLSQLGLVLAAEGDAAGAWARLTEGAHLLARSAGHLLAASAEREHALIVGRRRLNFERLVCLAAAAPDMARANGPDLLAAVLDWKAGSGRALTARQESLVLGGNARAVALHEELRQARQRWAWLMLRGPGAEGPEKYREDLKALADRRDDLERRLAAEVQDYSAVQRSRQAGPQELAERLGPGSVLVEIVKYRPQDLAARPGQPEAPPRYAAVLLARESAGPNVRLVALGEAGPIDRAVHAWRAAAAVGPVEAALEQQLRERVWRPLAEALPAGTRRVFLAPDGELTLLPFEAVRLEDGRYLVEAFQVSYLSNGRDLVPRPLPPADRIGPAVLLTEPDFDAVEGTTHPPSRPEVASSGKRSSELEKRGLHFKALPGFAAEAEAVARAWQAARPDDRLQILRGRAASEEALAELRQPRVLYLITHGFYLPDLKVLPGDRRNFELVPTGPRVPRLPGADEEPRLRSGLALAGANQWQKRAAAGQSDGLLTALEVQDLNLWGTELVVLAACETGLGQVEVGEGVLGLRRAFQAAGARTVLASLWQVPDRETARLMSDFCGRWLRGTAKAQALREAQLALLAELRRDADPKRRAAPPLYWAGFICQGQSD
jgi:CHAT domain-containing protein/Tfp pilus assembly protein PilF